MKTIKQTITDLISAWEDDVEIVEGLKRNTADIIKRIYFYKHDKYVECSDPNALFWQVVSQYVPHFSKLIDVDVKNLRPEGQGEFNFYQVWALRRQLQRWVEQENFGVEIDDLTKQVSSFGSFIWKVTDEETDEKEIGKCIEPCDLRNVAFDPTAKCIDDSNFVEIHYLTADELLDKRDIWDNVDELYEKIKDNKEKTKIYEYWGYDYTGTKNQYVHCMTADELEEGQYLYNEKADKEDFPYYDFHLYQFDGMWLRRGAYETCFPEQERANMVVNENAQATSIASLLLLRSNDPNTRGNVLRQAFSGQIITSSDLQQVAIDNRAFTTLLNELEKIERQVQKKLMLPDIATGDTLPSGTPLGGMELMSSSYTSAFKQIRQRISQGVVDVMLEEILPSLVKKWNSGTIIDIAEDMEDFKQFEKAVKDKMLVELYSQTLEQGGIVTPEDEATMMQRVDEEIAKSGVKFDTGKKFFDFDYGIVIDPTGENYDRRLQNETAINALNMMAANPALAEIPMFSQLLENNGITPFKLTPEQKQEMQQAANPQQAMPEMPQQGLEQLMQPAQ